MSNGQEPEGATLAGLGERLRQLRENSGLSQRELARRAGVTNATVSLIERDQTSPSVASLKKLLDVLGCSLADFFAHEPHTPQVFFGAGELLELAGGNGLSLRQVGRDLSAHSLQMLHETYEPGADTGEAMLAHEGEEAGIVVRGRIEITVGSEVRVLGPGEAYLFDSRLPHRFRNLADERCEIVSACSPPTF